MTPLTPTDRQRLRELLADLQLHQLSPEEHAELDDLTQRAGDDGELTDIVGHLLVAFDEAQPGPDLPAHLRDRLVAGGESFLAQRPGDRARGRIFPWLAAAAAILIGTGAIVVALVVIGGRDHALEGAQARIVELERRVADNAAILATARQRVTELESSLDSSRQELAAAESRSLDLAQQLADATSRLDEAQLTIAQYEKPQDPEVLRRDRELLLEVPDTIRIAWSPFDLGGAPPEQQGVQGDVVWNDKLEQGYLRFVGLEPNDPDKEQYQVWIVDERGMEQKVSGGVFNATAQGEVIVPIEPGIDVGRVRLFAVTVENPGGTWVPDLNRRVVVAPRGDS